MQRSPKQTAPKSGCRCFGTLEELLKKQLTAESSERSPRHARAATAGSRLTACCREVLQLVCLFQDVLCKAPLSRLVSSFSTADILVSWGPGARAVKMPAAFRTSFSRCHRDSLAGTPGRVPPGFAKRRLGGKMTLGRGPWLYRMCYGGIAAVSAAAPRLGPQVTPHPSL